MRHIGRMTSSMCAAALAALLTLPGASLAAQTGGAQDPSHKDYEGTREYAPDFWREEAIDFPKAPQKENLLPFTVPGSPYEHLIDRASITLGRDGVMRFVIVMRSGTARNVLFESLRCESRVYRTLAYGSASGQFRPRRVSRWRPIGTNFGDYRVILWERFLCDEAGNLRSVKEVIAQLLENR